MTWEEVAEALEKTDICLIAVGAIRQHGPHLPLAADSFSAAETLRAAARRLAGAGITVVIGPTIDFGMNPGAMSYPGSLNFQPETLKGILMDMGESLYQHGFRKLAFFVGHSENMHVMGVSAQKLVAAHPDLQVITLNPMAALADDGHAGVSETSRLLVTHPNLVRLDRARLAAGPGQPARRAIPGGAEPFLGGGVCNPAGDLHAYQRQAGHPGQAGDPRLASIAAGRAAYDGLAGWVADVIMRDFLGR
jgi:creatinine amidohydrolase